jgi:hypothetical protein
MFKFDGFTLTTAVLGVFWLSATVGYCFRRYEELWERVESVEAECYLSE